MVRTFQRDPNGVNFFGKSFAKCTDSEKKCPRVLLRAFWGTPFMHRAPRLARALRLALCASWRALRPVPRAPCFVLRASCSMPRAPCSSAPHLALSASCSSPRALSAPRAPRLVLSCSLRLVLCASCSAHLVLCLGLRARARALRLVLRCSQLARAPRAPMLYRCSVIRALCSVDRASCSDIRASCSAPRTICLLLLSLCVYCRSHTGVSTGINDVCRTTPARLGESLLRSN